MGIPNCQSTRYALCLRLKFKSDTFIKVTVVILGHEHGKLCPIVVINDRRQSLALNIVTWTHTQKVGKVSWHCAEGWVCCHGSKLGNVKTCKVWLRILYIKWHSWTNHGNNAFVNEILSCLKAKNNKNILNHTIHADTCMSSNVVLIYQRTGTFEAYLRFYLSCVLYMSLWLGYWGQPQSHAMTLINWLVDWLICVRLHISPQSRFEGWIVLTIKMNYHSSIFSSISLAESSPRDLQTTAYKKVICCK